MFSNDWLTIHLHLLINPPITKEVSMSLQKISAVTVITLSLAACGGGGGGTPSARPTDTNIENTKAEEARPAIRP